MKKIFTLSLFLFYVFSSNAQSHLKWTTTEITPGSEVNMLKGSATDASGNTYTINYTQSNTNFWITYRFFAYDKDGIKLWQYDNDSCFTNCNDNYTQVIPIDGDGAIFIGYYDDLSSNFQIRIKRIGLNGNLLWQNYWAAPYMSARPISATLDNAGNIVLGLTSFVTVANQEDYAIAKFDSNDGHNIWHYEIPDNGVSGFNSENLIKITVDANDDIYGIGIGGVTFFSNEHNYYFKINSNGTPGYIFGITNNQIISLQGNVLDICVDNNNGLYLLESSDTKTWVQKYEANTGNYVWDKSIQHDSAKTVPVNFICENSNLYVLSNYNYFIPDTTWAGGHWTNSDYMITKSDLSGNTVWENSYLENFDALADEVNFGGAVQLRIDNSYIYVLSHALFDSPNFDAYMLLNKLDDAGNIFWYDSLEANMSDGILDFDVQGNVYVSRTSSFNNSYTAAFTQKFGEPSILFVEQIDTHDLISTYPNPVSSFLNVNATQAFSNSSLHCELYDFMGKLIIDKKINSKQFDLDMTGFSTGAYCMKLSDESGSSFVKTILKN